MQSKSLSTADMLKWAAAIERRGLTDLALPLLDVLQVWGFVGAQGLWMLAPFLGQRLAPLATMLEQPELLQQFRQHLAEGVMQ